MKSVEEGKNFLDVLSESEVGKIMSREEIEALLDPKNYIGTAREQVENLLVKLQDFR